MQETAMCWGFECGDGWYSIIDKLCRMIQWHCSGSHWPGQPVPAQVVAAQVKEKFGTLRFYCDGGDATTDAYISFAETMTATTCEVCGNPGKLRGGGWIRALCDTHADKEA